MRLKMQISEQQNRERVSLSNANIRNIQQMSDNLFGVEARISHIGRKAFEHQSIQCDGEENLSGKIMEGMKECDIENSHSIITLQQQNTNQLPATFRPLHSATSPSTNNQTNISSKPVPPYQLNSIQNTSNNSNLLLTHQNKYIPNDILRFRQITPKPKVKKTIIHELTTQMNFHSSHAHSTYNKRNTSYYKNSTHLGNQSKRPYIHIHENKLKTSLPESLIQNYHKHDSRYFSNLQQYIKIFIQFQNYLLLQPFQFSLIDYLELIKQQMEIYLQKMVSLQNIPYPKPSVQWNQQKLTTFFTAYKPAFLARQSINSSINQKLTLKKYKNCVYFGHMINGKKQGEGVIYYFNGKLFEGTFKADQKIFGFQMQPDEYEIYIGEFDKGARHGLGMLKNNEYLLWGKFIMGQFGLKSEQDIKQLDKGQPFLVAEDFVTTSNFNQKSINQKQKIYNLKQKTSKMQGFKLTFNSIIVYSPDVIILKNLSNDIFIGSLNQETQQKHGLGLQIFMNGDLYIGNYENNIPESYGEYYWASGAFYRGEFLSGMRHGKGKWQMLHGDSFEGEYLNDKKTGQGTYLWKNGSKYIGAFQNDYRHGFGEMRWNDGRTYKGQWINGIQKNVTIQLDNGNNKVMKTKNISHTISMIPQQKKPFLSKRYNLPTVQKKAVRSVSIPSTRNSFQTIDSSFPVRKKITLQNIKALYNPSNH